MSRILLVIGLSSAKATAEPELVYLGRSGDAMRTALAVAAHPRFLIVPHVQGIPKNNSRAVANAASAAAAGPTGAELAEQALDDAAATVEQLRADIAARDAELTELRAKLASNPPGSILTAAVAAAAEEEVKPVADRAALAVAWPQTGKSPGTPPLPPPAAPQRPK